MPLPHCNIWLFFLLHFSPITSGVERGDENEFVLVDLKAMEGQEVFDDEDGDGDNTGQAANDEHHESFEDHNAWAVGLCHRSRSERRRSAW